jgi:hypothetical protein
LSFRIITMSSRNATNVSWSEMVTGLLSFDPPSRSSSVLTPEKGCPVRLQKCPAVEDFAQSPRARVLHIYNPWRKGDLAFLKPPDTGLPVGPRILTWYSDRPNISLGIPHPPTGGCARWELQSPHTRVFVSFGGKSELGFQRTRYLSLSHCTVQIILYKPNYITSKSKQAYL